MADGIVAGSGRFHRFSLQLGRDQCRPPANAISPVRVRASRRLDHAIVIRAGPRSDPLSWPAQLASHGGAPAERSAGSAHWRLALRRMAETEINAR